MERRGEGGERWRGIGGRREEGRLEGEERKGRDRVNLD